MSDISHVCAARCLHLKFFELFVTWKCDSKMKCVVSVHVTEGLVGTYVSK